MEEIYRIVSEYWFLDFYRVLKISEDGKYLISVDVYRRGFPFREDEKKCVDNGKYCIIYHYYPVEKAGVNGVEKIVITGIKAGDLYETVNTRWILSKDPGYGLIEEIFYKSWEIIGCRKPEDPWSDPCG